MSVSLKRQIRALINSGGSGYDDTEIREAIEELEDIVGDEYRGLVETVTNMANALGDESTPGTILARIKALEDK